MAFDFGITIVTKTSINLGLPKTIIMISYASTYMMLMKGSWIKPIEEGQRSRRNIMDFGHKSSIKKRWHLM